jgi:hypothetical protein
MKYLFIGGSKDGEWIEVNHFDTVDFPIEEGDFTTLETSTFKKERYERQKFSGEKAVFYIYVYTEISIDDMINKLLKNYKPKE